MYAKNRKFSVQHEEGPKIVGQARNSFGTRLCQRIECSRCHQTDYVSMKIASAKTKYCRSCAERLLETFEIGRVVAEKQVKRECLKCKTLFLVSEAVANKKDELQCKNCYRGFEVWRGKVGVTSQDKKEKKLIIKSGTKTIFRKIIDDSI